tara:strand:- start:74 stop:541 length:468 start_codon:yes stop_codon:yes gene_type:complete
MKQLLENWRSILIASLVCLCYGILITISSCTYEEPDIPCEVSPASQTGNYHMETEEVSGNCKSMGNLHVDIEDGIVFIDEAAGCVLIESKWDPFLCGSKSRFTCYDGFWAMNLKWTSISDPLDPETLTGTLEAEMRLIEWSCNSEYIFEAKRINK